MSWLFETILAFALLIFIFVGIGFLIDCDLRTMYWNDKGLFIDTWDYNPFSCDYPAIPQKINASMP